MLFPSAASDLKLELDVSHSAVIETISAEGKRVSKAIDCVTTEIGMGKVFSKRNTIVKVFTEKTPCNSILPSPYSYVSFLNALPFSYSASGLDFYFISRNSIFTFKVLGFKWKSNCGDFFFKKSYSYFTPYKDLLEGVCFEGK
ncbi:hypothetical protein AVEN_235478-1 [Araneus ventricosus]|uniref:Uncharacterized protein n=1 Tax=Araneus ventricosus TaxID=182803 RepID=A0A4Y2A4E8_ARAVE|nr:hypothetical protein AVEN_235478-1 [Araneus ventricosus]